MNVIRRPRLFIFLSVLFLSATANGIGNIRFEKPIAVWVENFLGFDPGTPLSTGVGPRQDVEITKKPMPFSAVSGAISHFLAPK